MRSFKIIKHHLIINLEICIINLEKTLHELFLYEPKMVSVVSETLVFISMETMGVREREIRSSMI